MLEEAQRDRNGAILALAEEANPTGSHLRSVRPVDRSRESRTVASNAHRSSRQIDDGPGSGLLRLCRYGGPSSDVDFSRTTQPA
jgi:hypothetical protein